VDAELLLKPMFNFKIKLKYHQRMVHSFRPVIFLTMHATPISEEQSHYTDWLLVGCLSPRSPGFAPVSIHVGFVVDKEARDRLLSEFFGFLLSILFYCRSPHSYIIWGMNNMSVSGSNSETCSHPIEINQINRLDDRFVTGRRDFL
jgi:hypothetical protein